MNRKMTLKDLNFQGKKALVRVDFNVPLDKDLNITDDSRIKASLPTIRYILQHGGSVILMSHLGRPKDKKVSDMSLKPCAARLSQLLKIPVQMADDCIGETTAKKVATLSPGEILLLENLRFHRGEEHPEEDPAFVKALALLGDVYVNDAFGSAHRAHASTTAVAKYFPGKAVAGLLMEKELEYLGNVLLNPKRPFYAILGGAKISTKFGVIKSLLQKADVLLIGGAMSFTFFKAQGIDIGNSLCEDSFVKAAKEILDNIKENTCLLMLPEDIVVVETIQKDSVSKVISIDQGVPQGYLGVDIGPKTISKYQQALKNAATVFWNGPLGVFECPPFNKGTESIAKSLSELSATTIIGGGDSIAAAEAAGVANKMSHLSTGGGASLEYLEFGKLPGVEALANIH